MHIDTADTHTVEVGYDELCGALQSHDLRALWSMQTRLMPETPVPSTQPWLWKWSTVFPLAQRAGELITIERGGDRRVLAFANPGLGGLPYTSTTLWGALQYLGPGESAPAHRHTPSAIRFVLTGKGVYTTVDGDACEMEPGDLILTPQWTWHDHNNYGDQPMVWFDGLDLPLVATLESIFFENHPNDQQPVRGHNLSQRSHALPPGLTPAGAPTTTTHSPLLRYAYTETDRALTQRHTETQDPMVTVEYRNPLTGGPAIPTLACQMSRLTPSARTKTSRKTGSSIYVVLHGSGCSVINSQRFEWEAGDTFVTPSWSTVDHQAKQPSDLFEISDRPVLEALHLYQTETLTDRQPVVGRFKPI
jgi:gentisate 1,2-dioxygenase